MIWLVVATAVTTPPPMPTRLVSLDWMHLGVRPAAYVTRDETAIGLTIQLSMRAL